MTQSLHILAACTDRKRYSIPSSLQFRTIPTGLLRDRLAEWIRRIECFEGEGVEAECLYTGEHWTVVKSLPHRATVAGFQPHLWVMSAGYGLIPATNLVFPYSATFVSGQPDSVFEEAPALIKYHRLQTWWEGLNESSVWKVRKARSITALAQENPGATFLIIASPTYLRAVEADLLNACQQMRDPNLLIITSQYQAPEPLQHYIVITEVRFRQAIGGSCSALSARLAGSLITNLGNRLSVCTARAHVVAALQQLPSLEQPKRKPMTDQEVKHAIERELESNPLASFSSLLRSMRDRGLACEYRRFKELFAEIRGMNATS